MYRFRRTVQVGSIDIPIEQELAGMLLGSLMQINSRHDPDFFKPTLDRKRVKDMTTTITSGGRVILTPQRPVYQQLR